MKLITCITRQSRLDDVLNALREEGIRGVTVSEVLGAGKQRGRAAYYGGEEYTLELSPKVKIELLVPADQCDHLVRLVGDAARTGEVGDGKVWVVGVESVLRIRTGEVGREAI
jgi:nitrogen regulatory protein P-II 1